MNFETVLNYTIQCVILSVKGSFVQKIIVKDSSVNDFDLLTQAFLHYVSNMDTKTVGKKQI